jgi:hypothetical protein
VLSYGSALLGIGRVWVQPYDGVTPLVADSESDEAGVDEIECNASRRVRASLIYRGNIQPLLSVFINLGAFTNHCEL